MRLGDDGWTGLYEVGIVRAGRERVVPLRGRVPPRARVRESNGAPFGAPGWTCYAPELGLELSHEPTADGELASLEALTDVARARVWLEPALRAAAGDEDLLVVAVRPEVMRYKRGSRCTVRLDVDVAGEQRARVVVAKTHHGAKGRNAHEAMTALWSSPLRHSEMVAIAEPLGYLPEPNILLQGPVPGDSTLQQELRAALADGSPGALEGLSAILRRAAWGLAELHGCGVDHGIEWRLEDEIVELRERTARLARFVPRLRGAAEPLLARLTTAAAAHPSDAPLPSHRSFRPGQVLIDGGDVGFIDFDTFGRAEPAVDLALFVSTFENLALRTLQARDGPSSPGHPARADHLALLEELSGSFLSAYFERAPAPVSSERVALWHALELFNRVVQCWTKVRFPKLATCVRLLAHHYGRQPVARFVA